MQHNISDNSHPIQIEEKPEKNEDAIYTGEKQINVNDMDKSEITWYDTIYSGGILTAGST